MAKSPRKTAAEKAPKKEPRVTDKQWAYARAFMAHRDKKRAAQEAGFDAWETNYCTIHKARGTQHALMSLAVELRDHEPVTHEYVMASLHELAERCMQARPVKDSKGKQVYQLDEEGNRVAALYTFQATGALGALTKLGEAIQMFRPPEKADDSVAERERAERDRNVLSELKRIADAVERKPGMQSAPVLSIIDGKKKA